MAKNSLHYFLFGCLLIILFMAPLFWGCTFEWTEACLTLAVSLLSMATLLAIVSKKIRIPSVFFAAYPFHICFMLLIVWQSLMPLWTEMLDANNYQRGLRLSITYYFIFNLVLMLCHTQKNLGILLGSLVAFGVCQAFYGILMVLSGIEYSFYLPKFFSKGIATGTLTTRNTFAGYLEITLACGLGLLLGHLSNVKFDSTRERIQGFFEALLSPKILVRLALAIMVIALVMSHSRMGNIAFFSSMIICGLIFMTLRKSFNRNAIILFVSLILIDTLIISQWFGLEKLMGRFEQTFTQTKMIDGQMVDDKQDDEANQGEEAKHGEEAKYGEEEYSEEVTNEGREKAWRESIPIVKDFALKGSGYGSYYILYTTYRTGLSKGFYDHAHSDYLEILIEFGIFGAICLGSLGFIAMFFAMQTLRLRKNKMAVSGAFAALMGVLSTAIHSFVDFNLYTPSNAAMVCVLLAISALSRWGVNR